MDGNSFKGQVLEFNRHPHNREAIKLDLVDRKILYLLSENARYSHTSLAKKLKIKRETISYRIKKMMDHDFLHGYLTLLDHRRLGFKNYLVYLKLRTVHNEKELLDYLSHFNEITRLKNCSGSFDVQIVSTVKKEEDFLEMMEKITNNYHSLIQRSEILKIIEEDFLGLSLLLNQDTSTNLKIIEHKGSSFQKEFGKHDPEVNLNQKDKDILNILKLDAKISIKNLSQKVNLSSISVENRIKKMIHMGVIKRFMPLASLNELGYQWWKVFFKFKNLDKEKFVTFLKYNPNILWYMRLLGKWDYQCSIFAKDNAEFHQILDNMRSEFAENIINYDSIIIHNQFKYVQKV